MTTSNASYPTHPEPRGVVPIEELARRQGIDHIKTVEELACDEIFETDEELNEFLEFVAAERQANLA